MGWGLALATLLLGAAPPQDWVPTPDDSQWMRGMFAGATAEDQAAMGRTHALLDQCRKAATARVRAELAALGEPAPALREESYGSEPCTSAGTLIPTPQYWGDWSAWVAANAQAGQLFAAFDHGVGPRRTAASPDTVSGALAGRLNDAVLREQAYRRALSWRHDGPKLDPLVWAALERRLWRAISVEDRANTAMLKTIVAEQGWPGIALVGEQASVNAWLIVQHADHDPAFQLRALRLMAPLGQGGDVKRSNYAFLHDRVMLKLAGKQRYGTQARCQDGKWVALPLEAPERVDALRAEMGMDSLADNLARITRSYGPCQSA